MDLLETLLPRVQKPARYVGGEYAAVVKDKSQINLRVAFCFPDTYEVGMSHLGLKLLYGLYNEQPDVWCERAFAPWPDMEALMREHRLPLYALESRDPLGEFDILGFTLQYELSYTNVLNMLDLAGLPIRADQRRSLAPLVIAGGPCTCNPEPLADFIDLFVIGEGEEVSLELFGLYRRAKTEDWDKPRFLRAAADIPGIYVPSLYRPAYNEDGTLQKLEPAPGVPARVTKRIIEDLDAAYFPDYFVVPSTEVIHERTMVEVMRGCIRGCRFCQAGYGCRPVRQRGRETLFNQATALAEQTGYEEISLTSLSTSDYRDIGPLCDALLEFCEKRRISLALPSQRADSFTAELFEKLRQVRQTGLTFAPEAGTQRLRDVINKNILEEDILNACAIAFAGGAGSVKLYFMMGLPTETDEDILGIANLAKKVLWAWRQHAKNRARGVKVTVSVACFVPKPHTPFQWAGQTPVEELKRRQRLLRDNMPKGVTYNWHEAGTSLLEAAFARGDRRMGDTLEAAWRAGCRFDAWAEHLRMDLWQAAFAAHGPELSWWANRDREPDEVLPWEHIDLGLRREFLWEEYQRALAGETSPDCRRECGGCGAISLLTGGLCDV